MADVQPSVLSGAFRKPFPEQVAFFRGKMGNLVPTARWDDLKKSGYDRGFMVAGAAKADLLADLAAAAERTQSEGKSIEAFRKDFRAIVEKHGWHGWKGEGSAAGEAWRTRTIYVTNSITSYAAGRLAQLREGNFPYWVYRHNDSVTYPRPLHQAWNGLTLPSDALWWKTHYPPNGWGCRCYVIGARSEAGARRLGGEPDKKPDPEWNKIDPKTGAPVGIGKGWDYAPGDSVSDTVQAMAKKTQQWEYSLAKAYMQDLPLSVRDDLARAYRELPSVADDVRRYAAASLEGRDVAPYRTLGLLTSEDVSMVAKLKSGLDVELHDYALSSAAVKHIHRQHGDSAREAAQGQRAVAAADMALLPDIVNSPDEIIDAGVSDAGRAVLSYRKNINGELYSLIVDVLPKRRMLSVVTLWIKKAP